MDQCNQCSVQDSVSDLHMSFQLKAKHFKRYTIRISHKFGSDELPNEEREGQADRQNNELSEMQQGITITKFEKEMAQS